MKKTLIAIHTVQRMKTPGKPGNPDKGIKATPPETETIAPGKTFEAEAEEARDLLAAGAARLKPVAKDDDDSEDAPKRGRKPAAKKTEPAKTETKTETKPEGGDGSEMV